MSAMASSKAKSCSFQLLSIVWFVVMSVSIANKRELKHWVFRIMVQTNHATIFLMLSLTINKGRDRSVHSLMVRNPWSTVKTYSINATLGRFIALVDRSR